MTLYDKDLPKHSGEQFKDIEGKINKSGSNLSNIIAQYREEIMHVLKNNEAEKLDDENTLKGLIKELNDKKGELGDPLLLGKTPPCKIDLSDNTEITNFWKSIVDNSNPMILGKPGDGGGSPTAAEKTAINTKIIESLEKIQFVHDDGTGARETTFKLFKGSSTDMTNIVKTSSNPLISQLLNETNGKKVDKLVKDFVNSVKSTKGKTGGGNPFYISTTKLDEKGKDEERKVAMRIALYLYCVYKIVNPDTKKGDTDKFSKALYTDINEKLDQIKNNEIPKIKGLHNTKVELGYLEPEYETLKDLNTKAGDVDLGEKDLGGGSITETRDLKADFESGIAVDIEKYSLKTSDIEVKDSAGNSIPVILSDGLLDFSDLSAGEHVRLSSDILLDIGGSRLKIGRIFIDNDTTHQLVIKFDDETTIKSAATASSLTLPSFPLDFSFKLKGTKKVSNGLDGCYASLTKKYFSKLKLGSSTPPVTLDAQREWQTTISNVDQVNRAIAEREADEELRERYRNVGWNIFDRANLFLRRKFIKDKIVREKMKGKEGFDWTDSGQSAAHRHQIEEKENLSDNLKVVVDVDEVNYPQTRAELDTLIDDYTGRNSIPPRQGGIGENKFQKRFNYILERSGKPGEGLDETAPVGASSDWKPLSEIIKSNDLKSLSTNLMMQAKQFQAHQFMVSSILNHIAANPTEGDTAFDAWCRTEIENYINTYDDIPDFLHQMKLSLDKVDDIKTLKKNDAALVAIQAQSLKYRLQILDGGDEAYNVKKDKGGLFTRAGRLLDDPTENTKLGKRLEKHPAAKEAFGWIRGVGKLAAIPAAMFICAPTGPLATAGIIGGVSALTTFVKKKSHYEKEHRSYQRMQATNLMDYRAKRTNLANEVAGMKWYEGRFWGKKKRTRDQYRDYVLATQDQLELTSDLIAKIKVELRKGKVLTAGERDSLGDLLADGLARLDFHKKTGQNFLGSNNPKQAEFEYKQLQNALIGGSLRLGIDVSDLRTKSPYDAYYNSVKKIIMEGTGDKYDTQGYQKARKRFKRRSNLKAIDSALLTGGVSFGLSYLASSLASRNTVETNDVYTSKSSGTYGGQYNPGNVDENLLISSSSPTGSINPEMYAHINGSTSEITGCQLYSSVDSLRCTASHGARELARASGNISASLSNPVVAGNPDLVTAVNNYMADVTRQVGMIPGLDAGNHDLVIARAYEALNSGVLDPIITSGNTSLVVNPTGFTWINGGVQASSTGTVGQAFRNMGIVGLDYVEKGTEEVVKHVTRAIAIPAGLNTFGSPKSDPK